MLETALVDIVFVCLFYVNVNVCNNVYLCVIILFREKKNVEAAEKVYRKLLSVNAMHANGLLGLARVKADVVQLLYESQQSESERFRDAMSDCMHCYEKCVPVVKEVGRVVVINYCRYYWY